MSKELHLRYPRRQRSTAFRDDVLSRERRLKARASYGPRHLRRKMRRRRDRM
jgi:hypothetical protein